MEPRDSLSWVEHAARFLIFVEPRDSLPCLQAPAANTCYEPDEGSLQPANPISLRSLHYATAMSGPWT